MKIAYLVNCYPKASHSFIRREIRGLEELGLEVLRISVRAPASDLVDARDHEEALRTQRLLVPSGIVLGLLAALVQQPLRLLRTLRAALRLGRNSDRGLLVHLVYLAEACALVRLARREGVGHVHAHFGTNPPAVCCLAHELGGLSYSFTVHGPEEFDRPTALKLQQKIAGARFVAAVSEFSKSQLYRWSPHADWQKIHVVHCGVDELFLAAERKPIPVAPRLVCVGRLCEQKGQLLLLEAAAQLAREGIPFELVLAGDGELRASLEAAIARHALGDRVRITGWISNERVRCEIEAARALVLPSFAEGLPVVLMEALALGRPVISTYVAGIPELVEPARSGWLVPAGDVAALTTALREVLRATPAALAELGRHGAERVRLQHDARIEAGKLAELFRRAA
ncbi:MAG: colanic acid biosynthesis glycosyltransferase WcaL [Planctomycetes bacterium]|nr:colanic acid biosynthesis glycosyltransferase WcaL [Planctomycetota bacterium]